MLKAKRKPHTEFLSHKNSSTSTHTHTYLFNPSREQKWPADVGCRWGGQEYKWGSRFPISLSDWKMEGGWMQGVGSGSGAEQTGGKTSPRPHPFCSYLSCCTFQASRLHPSSGWPNLEATSAILLQPPHRNLECVSLVLLSCKLLWDQHIFRYIQFKIYHLFPFLCEVLLHRGP